MLFYFTASKILGEWANEGSCNGEGEDITCGPGSQHQRRACTDGTIDKCTAEETQRTVTCEVAGTALPVCSKLCVLKINWLRCTYKPDMIPRL